MNRILLIDDDGDMLLMTERWLTKAGYDVEKATSGAEALNALEGEKPDLILLDYAMPEMDGPAVLKEIRKREELRGIPVLYRTGMEGNSINMEEAEVAPDGVVPKSEGKPSLMKAVEAALS